MCNNSYKIRHTHTHTSRLYMYRNIILPYIFIRSGWSLQLYHLPTLLRGIPGFVPSCGFPGSKRPSAKDFSHSFQRRWGRGSHGWPVEMCKSRLVWYVDGWYSAGGILGNIFDKTLWLINYCKWLYFDDGDRYSEDDSVKCVWSVARQKIS